MTGQKTPVVIQGGQLIDGNGGKPLDRATVIVEGNRIKRVAQGRVDFPKDARVIDASGKTILPGLIDNHVHYRNHSGQLFLSHGVTSVRDLGNPVEWILAQRDAIALGKIPGPRIFCAGGGFYGKATRGHHMVPADPEEARRMTKRLIERGVDYIKIHLGVPLDITRAVSDEAHSLGMRVSGHLEASLMPYAEAGVNGVEHATGCAEATIRSEEGIRKFKALNLWLQKFLGPWTLAEREHYPEVTDFLARKRVFIEPTMVLWGASLGKREKWEREDYGLLKNPGLAYIPEDQRLLWLDHHYLAYGPRVKEEPAQEVVVGNRYSIYGILPEDQLKDGHGRLQEFLCQLVKAGGNVVTGTDSGAAVIPGVSLHRELELMVAAGLSPMQAIQAATKVGADYLGRLKDLGTLEEGKLADLIVVGGNPLEDITQSRRIEVVIKDGEIIDTCYRESFSNPIPRPTSQEFYGYPIPRLEKLSPMVLSEGDGRELTLKGKDFFPNSYVCFGGIPVATSFINQEEIRATLPSYLVRVGTFSIVVINPKPREFPDQGGISNTLSMIVKFSNVA
ncbi:MAG: amidohydrolase family protein [Deltaproteobacteria bacterium]|nr:amidohydrolase family protein [Deltaproteobacteria bacterium]